RGARLSEIDEVLAFAADIHTGSAALMSPTVVALPPRGVVDRYAAVLEARQQAISEQLAQGKGLEVTGDLHDVALTARRIAGAFARAGRIGEIAPHLAKLEGLGEDGALRSLAAEIASGRASAGKYAELARMLRSEDHEQVPDPAAALAVARAGLVK